MIAGIKKRAQRRLLRRLRSRHQQIVPVPIQGLFNFRCHENCLEYLRTHVVADKPNLTVVEAIYVDDGEPVLHYLLRNEDNGEYWDVTLGYRAPQLEMYVIRDLLPADHGRIYSEMRRSLDDWTEEFVPWFWRKLFNIDRIL